MVSGGKKRACLALGLAACQRGFSFAFTTAAELVHQLIVNGGVKAGQWGGAKSGPFALSLSSRHRVRPGGDGRDVVAGADAAFRKRW